MGYKGPRQRMRAHDILVVRASLPRLLVYNSCMSVIQAEKEGGCERCGQKRGIQLALYPKTELVFPQPFYYRVLF